VEAVRAVRSGWGSGAAASISAPSVRSIRQLAMVERMSASPGMARAALEAVFRTDVRSILPTITAPTLVIHARDEVIPVQEGRYIADHIPGARLLEVDGNDHVPWLADPDRFTTELEEFLTGGHAAPSQSRRALRTVLFTDMVASTQHAAATGDERWRAVLQRFGEVTADLTQQFGGTVVKSTGDGHLTTFDGPTQAIRCAEALRGDAATLGIQIRVGIHTGECELMDGDIGGLAVHIAARIMGQAGAGGNCWRSIATARGRDRPRQSWHQCRPPAVGPRCAVQTAPWRSLGGAHRGFSAGWPTSPRPPAAAEQPESARLEVSESTTSLTGESHSDATDADASVLANDPTFTSCLGSYCMELSSNIAADLRHDYRLCQTY
jgi:class 3 adenylate cyclase